jgi:hypothetical protein
MTGARSGALTTTARSAPCYNYAPLQDPRWLDLVGAFLRRSSSTR